MRHNEIRDGVVDLARKSFNPVHMHDDPLILAGRAVQRTKPMLDGSTQPPSKNNPEATKQKGDLLIHELWKNENDSVHDMRLLNTDDKFRL